MEGEIVNRVANSALVTFNLEDFYPEGPRVVLDISQWLFEGLILKEKDFRSAIKNLDLSMYRDSFVALSCSTDAIIPAWAYMLVASKVSEAAKKVVVGSLNDLETLLFAEIIEKMDVSHLENQPVIIKGCAHKPIPENAYILIAQKLRKVARSVMYGEACSAVPLYKNK